MIDRENPIFGRKIFFVSPQISVEHYVLDMLHDHEYEAYVINDYKMVKGILRANKDAMCFINLDSSLNFKQWFNYIHSFQDDEILKTVFVGVISAKATSSDARMFLMNLKLNGGFTFVNEDVDAIYRTIQGILDLNGAKGQRKYIRLDCARVKDVQVYLAHNDKLFDFSIKTLSSVGFACTYPDSAKSLLIPNTQFNNVSLTLGRKSIVAPSIVLKVTDDKAVMLFNSAKISKEDKFTIKNFISDELTKKFNGLIDDTKVDNRTYSSDIDPSLLNSKEEFEGDKDIDSLLEEI